VRIIFSHADEVTNLLPDSNPHYIVVWKYFFATWTFRDMCHSKAIVHATIT